MLVRMWKRNFSHSGPAGTYIKWTGEGLSRDLRNISMEEGTCMLLDMEEGYSGALWTMNPMEICWKFEDVMLG